MAEKVHSQTELDRPTFSREELGGYVWRESCRALEDGTEDLYHEAISQRMNELQSSKYVPWSTRNLSYVCMVLNCNTFSLISQPLFELELSLNTPWLVLRVLFEDIFQTRFGHPRAIL